MAETLSRFRLLIVDDEPGIRAFLAWRLRARGLEVLLANDGREALDRLERQSFDLVIADVTMPRLEGLPLLEAIKSRYPTTQSHSHVRFLHRPDGGPRDAVGSFRFSAQTFPAERSLENGGPGTGARPCKPSSADGMKTRALLLGFLILSTAASATWARNDSFAILGSGSRLRNGACRFSGGVGTAHRCGPAIGWTAACSGSASRDCRFRRKGGTPEIPRRQRAHLLHGARHAHWDQRSFRLVGANFYDAGSLCLTHKT